jgi:hypothetical protein
MSGSQLETSSVYTMREINLELCTFMKPEKFEGYHESYISVNGSKGFVLQSPKLVLRSSTLTYFEFLISRNKDRHTEFYNIISHLEDSAIIQIANNSKEWFNREIRRDQVETMFRSCIHRPLDINDPYILRINKISGLSADINHQTVCLLKIDGIFFGKNTSMLDMKVIQIKVVKTEKIPSEDGYVDQGPSIPTEKPFYNDNASVVPHNFSEQQKPTPLVTNLPSLNEEHVIEHSEPIVENISNETMIEKIDEFHYVNEETKQLEEIEKTEKLLTLPEPVIQEPVQEPIEPPSPVKSIRTVRTQPPVVQPVVQPVLSVDSIKCEIMKAIVENDFQRVKELSEQLKLL